MRRKRGITGLAVLLACCLVSQSAGIASESVGAERSEEVLQQEYTDSGYVPQASEVRTEDGTAQGIPPEAAAGGEAGVLTAGQEAGSEGGGQTAETGIGSEAGGQTAGPETGETPGGSAEEPGSGESDQGTDTEPEGSEEQENTEPGSGETGESEPEDSEPEGSEAGEPEGSETEEPESSETAAALETVSYFASGYAADTIAVYETGDSASRVIASVPEGTKIAVIAALLDESIPVWYQVIFQIDEYSFEGYVRPETVILTDTGISLLTLDPSQNQEFPADYQALIDKLKANHPNWVFEPLYVGLDFNQTVAKEREVVNRNLVAQSQAAAWKSMETLGTDSQGRVYNYSWGTDTWFHWEPNFVAASELAVRYCLDPRNFINETYIFMFEKLQYEASCQSVETVNELLKGTFMYNVNVPGEDYTYAWLLHWIGEKYNINPVMLASRLRQEQGVNGTSELISGVYPGFENLYNHFNIMASGQTREEIVRSGLSIARTGSSMILPDGSSYQGSWDTPTKSMIGGALNIATSFILAGQDSLYLQKFDVDNSDGKLYWHQYMQNIQAPMSESQTVRRSYTDRGLLDAPFVFKIPVFENMPASTERPADNSNPNNCLAALEVDGNPVIAEFDKDRTEYSYEVPYGSKQVTVTARAASELALVNAPSQVDLQVGDNRCQIQVTAQNGETKTYTLTITRKSEESSGGDQNLGYGELRIENQTIYIGLGNQTYGTVSIPYYALTWSEDRTSIIIDGLDERTDAQTFLKNIDVKGAIWAGLFDEDEVKQYTGTDIVGTGVYLVITDSQTGRIVLSSPIILHGDLNGDGQFNIIDFSLGKAALLGRVQLTEAQELAGDLNGSGGYNILDFSTMKAVLLGRIELQQRKTE